MLEIIHGARILRSCWGDIYIPPTTYSGLRVTLTYPPSACTIFTWQYELRHWCIAYELLEIVDMWREVVSAGVESPSRRLEWREGDVTKVTVHLPPTATHLLGECTVPPHALLLVSSDVPDEVDWDEVFQVKRVKMKMNFTIKQNMKKKMLTVLYMLWTIFELYIRSM